MHTKICLACNEDKPLTEYYFHKSGKQLGQPLPRCRACHNARSVQWQKANMDKKLKCNSEWRKRNADRVRVMKAAHNMVNNAIRSGKLQRGTVCSRCGAETYVEASHADYSKPLEFNWLCKSCHRTEDSNNPKS